MTSFQACFFIKASSFFQQQKQKQKSLSNAIFELLRFRMQHNFCYGNHCNDILFSVWKCGNVEMWKCENENVHYNEFTHIAIKSNNTCFISFMEMILWCSFQLNIIHSAAINAFRDITIQNVTWSPYIFQLNAHTMCINFK